MKHEWKKQEKQLYGAKKTPAILLVPQQTFIMMSGKGNPNDADFSTKVSALYSLAYGIKGHCKAANSSNGLCDFSVYPLEGIWKKSQEAELVKEKLEYTIMIRQPDFVTRAMVWEVLKRVEVKKPNPFYKEIRFDTMEDGKTVEILHVGSFDDEPASFQKMDQFTEENGLKRRGTCHREIYLNNANRTEKSKLKTILRYGVE